jgi:hypothetical protein
LALLHLSTGKLMGNLQANYHSEAAIRRSTKPTAGRAQSRRTRKRTGQSALAQSVIETLELRRLLSTSVNLSGDAGSNSFYILNNSGTIEFFKNEPTTATPTLTIAYADLGPVTITGGGSTTITLDYTGGDLLPSGLSFTGQGPAFSPNQLTVIGATGAGYVLGSSSLCIAATAGSIPFTDSLSFTSLSSFNLTGSGRSSSGVSSGGGTSSIEVASGSPHFNSNLGASATVDMTVDSGASVYFGVSQTLDSLTINPGGFVQMLPTGTPTQLSGGQVLDTNNLVVNGILDLTENDLIVNDATATSGEMTTLETAIATFDESILYGGTPTTAQGVIESSSAVADSDSSGNNMVVGYAPASVLTYLPSLDGQAIPSTALVTRYTLEGDLNLDGSVDIEDFNVLSGNFNRRLSNDLQWYEGDLNFDGSVNIEGYLLLTANFNDISGTSPTAVTVGSSYPVELPNTTPTGQPIARWDLDWGDGDFDSYLPDPSADFATASHTYLTANTMPNIQMWATTASGDIYHAPATPLAITASGVTATALSFTASASTDVFAITSNGTNTIITQNGTAIEDEPTEDILALSITGGAATVAVNFAGSDPLPIGGLYTDASNIELDGPHSTDELITTSTAAYIGGDEIRYSATTTLTDNLTSDGGILAIAGTTDLANPAGDSLTVAPGATVLVSGSQTFSSLTIDAGATVRQIAQDTTLGDTVIT